MGGFYLFATHPSPQESLIYTAFPSLEIFSESFNPFYHMISFAVNQRQCFSVDVPSSINFMLAPIIPCPGRSDCALGVVVLGVPKCNEFSDNNTLLDVLATLATVISSFLRYIHAENENLFLKLKLKETLQENSKLKNNEMKPIEDDKHSFFLCTTPTGVITYLSDRAQMVLGYEPQEVVGFRNAVELLLPSEVEIRAQEMGAQLSRKIGGFQVLAEGPLRGEVEARKWTLVTKNGSFFPVTLSVELLFGEFMNITGFILTALEGSL
jgi:PAS domain-containing protein